MDNKFNPFKGLNKKDALKLKEKIFDDLGIDPNEKRLSPQEKIEEELGKLAECEVALSELNKEIEARYDTQTMKLKDQSGTEEDMGKRNTEGTDKVKRYLKLSEKIRVLKEISANLEELKSGGFVEAEDRRIINRRGMKEYAGMLEKLS